jgi:hypothetical protein
MIYDSLRKLPMITYIEIIDTGNLSLLSDEELDIVELIDIWQKINEEYQNRYNLQNSNKVFNLSKEIEYLENKHLFIKYAVEALKFDYNAEVVERIIDYGYRITKEKYLDDLERILRESNAIVNKINLLKNSLPKKAESESKGTEIIVDSMANYSSILGFDFDFYAISVEKFHSIEKQVKNKIAAIEKNNAKNKK